MLFARDHEFRRGQGVGKFARFDGDARRIDSDESRAENDRNPVGQDGKATFKP